MTNRKIPLFDFRELCGLAARSNPGRDEQAKIKRWATLLLERSVKTVGGLLDPQLERRLIELGEERPNFAAVIEWLLAEMAYGTATGEGLAFCRLLLVGPAGSGKTSFALDLATILGLPAEVVHMNNLQTGSFLGGSERHWSNSEPGALLRLLSSSRVINPMMVLDEIDKVHVGSTNAYDPLSALFTLLERTTAERFVDAAIPDVHLDASHVNWIATANEIDRLSGPLRSRFNVFPVRALRRQELLALTQRMYTSLVLGNPGIASRLEACLPDDVAESLVSAMASGRDVDRTLRMLVGRALRTGQRRVSVMALPLEDAGGSTGSRIGFL